MLRPIINSPFKILNIEESRTEECDRVKNTELQGRKRELTGFFFIILSK
jgi:hypothetical protein